MIEKYDFGQLRHAGKDYSRDVIIYPERVDASWWRKEGHRLDRDDLKEVVKAKPDVLVVGTGYYGQMRVPKETLDFLNSLGIEVHAGETKEAVKKYNELKDVRKVVAALHLTC